MKKAHGAGWHVVEIDMYEDYWLYAASRGVVVGAERRLEAEARMNEISQTMPPDTGEEE